MKRNVYITIGSLGLLMLMCCFIWAVTIGNRDSGPHSPENVSDFAVRGSSWIDPQTILQSLEQGDMSVFQLGTDIPRNPQFVMPVEWTQAEFMSVADALFRFVWIDSMDNWNLYRMNFVTNCKNDPKGFSDLDLFFYQDTVINGIKKYSVRTIQIYPDYGYVAWGGETYYPRSLFGWKTINLAEMKTPVDEALNIAEEKGGMNYRISVKNACWIAGNLNPEMYNRYAWDVDYRGNEYPFDNMEFWIPLK